MEEAKKIYGTNGEIDKSAIIVGDLNTPLGKETERVDKISEGRGKL